MNPLLPSFWAASLVLLLPLPKEARAQSWQLVEETRQSERTSPAGISYRKRSIRSPEGKLATVQLVFFNSRQFKLEVVDLGNGNAPDYPSIPHALRAAGCIAGVNGGFFHPDFRPAGLVIAQGKRIHRFESAKLLSGVVYCDDRGIHIVRRAAFQDHSGITALLQTGPYLMEAGSPVRGLSKENPRRRTFIATDWRGNWALGLTSSLSLHQLASLLDSSKTVTGWTVNRAINLDGGSSSALYFEEDSGLSISALNWKRVRNALGVSLK